MCSFVGVVMGSSGCSGSMLLSNYKREKRKDNGRGVEKNQFAYVVFPALSETCLVRFSSFSCILFLFFLGLIHHLL
jgi:hypothetical protein